MNLLENTSYKNLIKEKMTLLKQINSKYTFDALAKAMNVHKPYLSRVVNQKGDFNLDQLFLCANYLKLNELEKKFLFLLFEENNCYIPERKSQLQKEIEKVRKKSLKSEALYNHDSTDSIVTQKTSEYYLDPSEQLSVSKLFCYSNQLLIYLKHTHKANVLRMKSGLL